MQIRAMYCFLATHVHLLTFPGYIKPGKLFSTFLIKLMWSISHESHRDLLCSIQLMISNHAIEEDLYVTIVLLSLIDGTSVLSLAFCHHHPPPHPTPTPGSSLVLPSIKILFITYIWESISPKCKGYQPCV